MQEDDKSLGKNWLTPEQSAPLTSKMMATPLLLGATQTLVATCFLSSSTFLFTPSLLVSNNKDGDSGRGFRTNE